MALTLPLLLVLLLGMIIAVFMFYSYVQVTNAAREGARAGSVYRITNPTSGLSLIATVQKAIYDPDTGHTALGFLSPTGSAFDVGSDVAITLLRSDGAAGDLTDPRPGDRLTVEITYRYTLPIVAVALPMLPQPMTVIRSVTMEIQ